MTRLPTGILENPGLDPTSGQLRTRKALVSRRFRICAHTRVTRRRSLSGAGAHQLSLPSTRLRLAVKDPRVRLCATLAGRACANNSGRLTDAVNDFNRSAKRRQPVI